MVHYGSVVMSQENGATRESTKGVARRNEVVVFGGAAEGGGYGALAKT